MSPVFVPAGDLDVPAGFSKTGDTLHNTDLFTVTNGTKSSVALTLGREWHRSTDWFPVYALGLQYERFILGSIKGTITQYQLPQFLNYSYTWNTHADLLSLYSKITLVQYGRFSPFINGGIGWAMNRSSHFYATVFPGTTARFSPAFGDHTQNNVAFNLGAGVNYDLSAQWSASLAYNYQYLGTLRSSNGVDTWAGEYLNIKNYQINMLSLGAAYHFD